MFPIKSQHAADPAYHSILSLGRKHVELPGSYEMTDEGTGVRDHYLTHCASQAAAGSCTSPAAHCSKYQLYALSHP